MLPCNFGENNVAEPTRKFLYTVIGYTLIAVIVIVSVFAYFNTTGAASKNNMSESMYHSLFGATPIAAGNYSFSPPVQMYRAVIIALENGGWNATSLQNMTVHVYLDYDEFYTNVSALYQLVSKDNVTLSGYPNPDLNVTESGFGTIYEVTAPVDNYQPQIINGAALRYVWTIIVYNNSDIFTSSQGYYIVDAATAQLIPVTFNS